MFSITCRPSGRQFHSISFQLNGAGRFASSEKCPTGSLSVCSRLLSYSFSKQITFKEVPNECTIQFRARRMLPASRFRKIYSLRPVFSLSWTATALVAQGGFQRWTPLLLSVYTIQRSRPLHRGMTTEGRRVAECDRVPTARRKSGTPRGPSTKRRAKSLIPPFPFPPRASRGWRVPPTPRKRRLAPQEGISRRSAKIPLSIPPFAGDAVGEARQTGEAGGVGAVSKTLIAVARTLLRPMPRPLIFMPPMSMT